MYQLQEETYYLATESTVPAFNGGKQRESSNLSTATGHTVLPSEVNEVTITHQYNRR